MHHSYFQLYLWLIIGEIWWNILSMINHCWNMTAASSSWLPTAADFNEWARFKRNETDDAKWYRNKSSNNFILTTMIKTMIKWCVGLSFYHDVTSDDIDNSTMIKPLLFHWQAARSVEVFMHLDLSFDSYRSWSSCNWYQLKKLSSVALVSCSHVLNSFASTHISHRLWSKRWVVTPEPQRVATEPIFGAMKISAVEKHMWDSKYHHINPVLNEYIWL